MGDRFKIAGRRVLVASLIAVLASCGGGGGGGGNDGGGGTTTTTVSGKITFDRVPIDPNNGLNFNAVTQVPARGVTVQAIQGTAPTGASLASAVTDPSGNYTLTVPSNTTMLIRVDAQMTQTGSGTTWNIRVLNNANSNALYTLVSSSFSSGTSASTHDLNAASGWNGTRYVDANRTAAPFAILDTVYQAKQLMLGAQPALTLPALDLYWSTANLPNTPQYCPADGRIRTTAYIGQSSNDNDCSTVTVVPAGIYVLGSATGDDTDEYDQHVIAHEFGHYVEDKIVGRGDSIGGQHGSQSRLDPRVAFSEGWGNAFSGMVLNDPAYKDTLLSGATNGFNLENGAITVRGWYSETSVGQILWDIFDSQDESGDSVHLGFSPILATLQGPYKDSDALSTIYSFTEGLRAQNASSAQGIRDLEVAHNIQGRGAFVEQSPETNNGNDTDALPLYTPINLNSQLPAPICTDAANGQYNRLNNRRFFPLTLSSSTNVTINVFAGSNTQDPDLRLLRRGQQIASATGTGSTDSIVNMQLAAGVYVIEAFDFAYADPSNANVTNSTRHCLSLNVTGQ